MAKNSSKKSPAKVETKKVKSVAKVAKKEKAPKVGAVELKPNEHIVTQADLDTDPKLLKKGLKVGDIIKVKAKGTFHIEISVNDEVFKADTDSIAETILQLPVGQLKTKVVIQVSTKTNKAEFVLFNIKAKRLFTNAMAAQGFEKNVKLILNER